MQALNREQILGAKDLTSERVKVPEWGGEVIVRSLTAGERDSFEASLFTGTGGSRKQNIANIRARLVALTAVGDDGKRLFTDADVLALGGKSASAMSRVFDTASRLNGLSTNDVEDLAKNSAGGQKDNS